MWSLLPVFLLIWASPGLRAQDDRKYPTTTSAISNGRFEVVQSSIMARDTFRLDRFTGRLWQLVENQDKDVLWEEMVVVEAAAVITTANFPRFQVFISGIAARTTLLLDSVTGKTWILSLITRQDKSTYTAWIPMSVVGR